MSNTATLAFHPGRSILDRIVAFIGKLLRLNAEMSARNGDLPYFGL
jgi:hypothetical protein